jgi:hypothetical protein
MASIDFITHHLERERLDEGGGEGEKDAARERAWVMEPEREWDDMLCPGKHATHNGDHDNITHHIERERVDDGQEIVREMEGYSDGRILSSSVFSPCPSFSVCSLAIPRDSEERHG